MLKYQSLHHCVCVVLISTTREHCRVEMWFHVSVNIKTNQNIWIELYLFELDVNHQIIVTLDIVPYNLNYKITHN